MIRSAFSYLSISYKCLRQGVQVAQICSELPMLLLAKSWRIRNGLQVVHALIMSKHGTPVPAEEFMGYCSFGSWVYSSARHFGTSKRWVITVHSVWSPQNTNGWIIPSDQSSLWIASLIQSIAVLVCSFRQKNLDQWVVVAEDNLFLEAEITILECHHLVGSTHCCFLLPLFLCVQCGISVWNLWNTA